MGPTFGYLFSFPTTSSSVSESQKASDLTGCEKECYTKIVKALLHHCKHRVVETTDKASETQNSPTYCIIFRQTDAWAPLEEQLKEIADASSKDEYLTATIKYYLDSILALRQMQLKYLNSVKTYRKTRGELAGGKIRAGAQLEKIQKYTHQTQLKIQMKLKEIHAKIRIDLVDTRVTNEAFQKVCNFIDTNWKKLTVFANWTEISLDKKILCVQIRRAKNSIDTITDKSCNVSTKGIFVVQERPPKVTEFPFKDGQASVKIVLANGVQRIRSIFAPQTPGSKKQAPKLTEEDLFDIPLPDKPSTADKTYTSMAPRLQIVVDLAIEDFNKKISPLDSSNNESPSSKESSFPSINKIVSSFMTYILPS